MSQDTGTESHAIVAMVFKKNLSFQFELLQNLALIGSDSPKKFQSTKMSPSTLRDCMQESSVVQIQKLFMVL